MVLGAFYPIPPRPPPPPSWIGLTAVILLISNIEISTCGFYFNNNIPKQSKNDVHVRIFLGPETLLKKENLAKVLSCEFQENFNNTLFIEWKWKLKKASFSQRFYILVQVYLPSMFRTCALETVQSCIS